ncbi:MAG: hypothetical protein AB9872_04080 [Solidesulfovibrio sp.]
MRRCQRIEGNSSGTDLENHYSHFGGQKLTVFDISGDLNMLGGVISGSMDGKTYGLNESKPVLPAHWRCRCLYLPVSVTWRSLGIDIDEYEGSDETTVKHSESTVHHKDGSTSTKFTVKEVGKVPAGTTYET